MIATADKTASVADELREARLAADLTQAELADRAGVSLKSVSRLEQGWEPQGRSLVEQLVRRTLADVAAEQE